MLFLLAVIIKVVGMAVGTKVIMSNSSTVAAAEGRSPHT